MTQAHTTGQERALREALKDMAKGVFVDAATQVHYSWIVGTNGRAPDFGEAASDYAESFADAYVEMIGAALPHQPATDEGEWLTKRIAEMVNEDGGCWSACSGCQESVDGYVSSKDYPRSSIFKCQPGSGCRECGGLGVIWQDGAFLAGYGEALSTPTSQPPAAETRLRAMTVEAVCSNRRSAPVARSGKHGGGQWWARDV